MEQASVWHSCMVPRVATLATWWEAHIPPHTRCKQKPKTTGHDGKGKRKPQTQILDHKRTMVKPTLEGKTVDFSEIWWIKEPLLGPVRAYIKEASKQLICRQVLRPSLFFS